MPDAIAFGPFRLDLRRRVLTTDGELVPLSPRALDILCRLGEADNQLLSKNDLLNSVWPDRVVDENYLHVLISGLRKALGQVGRDCLVTVPGYGYRLLMSIQTESQRGPSREQLSVAIPPLRNLMSDPRLDPICFGFMGDLATNLSRTRWLSVVALDWDGHRGRSGVPGTTGASYHLTGSLRCVANVARISIRLTDSQGIHVWGSHYDNAVEAPFQTWDQIATKVVAAVEIAVMDAEQQRLLRLKVENRRAWEAFAQGVWHFTRARYDDNERAVILLQNAIDFNPEFSSSYQWLAYAHIQNGVHFRTWSIERSCGVAEPVAFSALDLDASDAGGHTSLGFIAKIGGNLGAGLARAEQALALNSYDGDALRLKGSTEIALGFHEQGARTLWHSIQVRPLDPQNWRSFDHLSVSAHMLGDYDTAVALGYRALRSNSYQTVTYPWLISSLARLGRIDDARAVIAQVRSASSPRPFDESIQCRSLWLSEAEHARVLEGCKLAGWRK